MSILQAEGTLGRPGMVMMSPQITTTNPAPAASRHVAELTTCPVGRPSSCGSVESEYCVLAMQIGKCAEAGLLQLLELVAELLVGQHVGGAVDLGGDDAHLLPERAVSG